MRPTAASTRMARSSQVRSIERSEGVSMVDVVIDDMAIGNPASQMAQRWRFWASLPGIHIAQFPFRVIDNCGLNGRAALQQSMKVRICRGPALGENTGLDQRFWPGDIGFCAGTSPVIGGLGDVHNMTVSWPRRLRSFSAWRG